MSDRPTLHDLHADAAIRIGVSNPTMPGDMEKAVGLPHTSPGHSSRTECALPALA